MTSRLSTDQLTQLAPLLGSVARMIARGSAVGRDQLRILLRGAEPSGNESALGELQLWADLLMEICTASDSSVRHAAVEALMLRGLPEATVLLAADTVTARAKRPVTRETPSGSAPGEPSASQGEQELLVTPERLEWTLKPGEPATATLQVTGGPGRIVVDSDQIKVMPEVFGTGPTDVLVRVAPLTEGMLWSSLKVVTPGETIEVPVLAQWSSPQTSSLPSATTSPIHTSSAVSRPWTEIPIQPRPVQVAATKSVKKPSLWMWLGVLPALIVLLVFTSSGGFSPGTMTPTPTTIIPTATAIIAEFLPTETSEPTATAVSIVVPPPITETDTPLPLIPPTEVSAPDPHLKAGRIAFTSYRDGPDGAIYVMNADGTQQTRLTNSVGGDRTPLWSPDGQRIAFVSFRDGHPEIYIMNADGTQQTRLTNSAKSVGNWITSWLPDGRQIAFTSYKNGSLDGTYIMNADGTGQTRLSSLTRGESPVWSPDGQLIAFLSVNEGSGDRNISIMSADGTEQTRLTDNTCCVQVPAWSPDGKRLTFSSGWEGNYEVYVINADGTGQTNLTRDLSEDMNPAWSPDGHYIVFDSDRDHPNPTFRDVESNIYIMNADGTGLTQLTNTLHDFEPTWSLAAGEVGTRLRYLGPGWSGSDTHTSQAPSR